MPLVKKACKLNRELKALRLREDELLVELNELPPTRANQPRLLKIEGEIRELSGQIGALLAEVWPSGGRRPRQGNLPGPASAQ